MKISYRFVLGLTLVWALPVFSWTLVSPSAQGWSSRDLVVHWNFSACTVTEAEMLARLDQAIASWNGVSGADLRLSRASTASSASAADFLAGTVTTVPIVLCDANFSTNNSVDADFIPAATRLSMPSGPIEYGGVLLNAESGAAAELGNLTREQIAVILAHELGHVLGLGHSSVERALMYYSITDKTTPTITEDDQDGLSFLYPRNEFSGNLFGCSSVRQASRNSASENTRAVLSALLVLAALVFSVRLGMQIQKNQI